MTNKKDRKRIDRKQKQINYKLFDSPKTGCLKVRQRLQKEHQKKILEAKLKVDTNKNSTMVPEVEKSATSL